LKRMILLRHGATAGNLERRYIGSTDQPLCETGIAQAKAVPALPADRIVVSPLLRARQTAELVFPGRKLEICADLRESHFGIFEGKTAEELKDDPDYTRWVAGGCTGPIPQGELTADFKARCCAAFLREMARSADNSTTVFVVHGGVIMAILEAFSRPKRDFYAWQLPNCGCFWAEMAGNEAVLTVVSEKKL